MKRNGSGAASVYFLQLMTGETLVYNNLGQIVELWDTVAPTPNKVQITWTGVSNGNVAMVVDASKQRRLNFSYSNNRLTTLKLQARIAGAWVTKQTTTYNYSRCKVGLNLKAVTIGGKLPQKYTYDAGGKLSKIQDNSDNQMVAFSYSSSSAGQVDLVSTSRGTVGFEYASTRAACRGKTMLYFNQENTKICSVDVDCGSGYLCGGKTGSGSTGTCFQAGRCLTLGTVNGESVVTDVAPIGPGGGSCTGACSDVMHYVWSPSAPLLNATGLENTLTNYTSIAYCTTTGAGCATGAPYQIGYGDTDSDPTNGGYNRTVWFYYDTTYPGRIAEIRRPSDLSPSASQCSYANATGCTRTLFTYGAAAGSCQADNQLCQVQQVGYTLDGSGNPVLTAISTLSVHDSLGRIAEIDGPTSGMKTMFDYYTDTDAYPYFQKDLKSYSDSTNFVMKQYLVYDTTWGVPTTVQEADGKLSCYTFDGLTGYMKSLRRPMGGQTDCGTEGVADIKTSWYRHVAIPHIHHRVVHGIEIGDYDMEAGPLLRLTRPDGSCFLYGYDAQLRLTSIKRRDDCSSLSAGDTRQLSYTTDGALSQVDVYDSSGALKESLPLTYTNGKQLKSIINPADPSHSFGFQYDSASRLVELDGPAGLSKTVYHYDGAPGREGRTTSDEVFKTTSMSDRWNVLYSWMGLQAQLTDGDNKVTKSVLDDFGRTVKIASPDLANPSIALLDASGNVTTLIQDRSGGGAEQTHTFTYDYLNRPLGTNFQGNCPTTGTAHAEIQRTYDAVAPGTCPIAAGCNNLGGRLAIIETTLMCSSAYGTSDGALDQFTYYSYDAAGRVVEEYITDDSGRIADHQYGYTKNGDLASITTPSGAIVGWNYGSSSNNSDADLVTGIWRGNIASPVVDTVRWFPFGPLQQYNQENMISSTPIQTVISRNLAYRVTDIKQKSGATTLFDTAISEDAMARTTSRVYNNGGSGVQSSFFLYDEQSRVTCETSDTQVSCPTTGTNIKNNHSLSLPFMNAGDWRRVLRPVAGSSGGLINDFNTSGTAYGGSHQVTHVNQSDGTPSFGDTAITYDAQGSRASDDNMTALAHDRRDFSYTLGTGVYHPRHNVTNVRGQYHAGGGWHYYDVSSAFDAWNRRVFKSFYDETTLKTASWYFYYDPLNRLTEVRYTPDNSASGRYTIFQLFWLRDQLTAYWETDYPGPTTSKRYVGSDGTGRPIDMWSWPSSGNATRVWAVNPSGWGLDTNKVGPTIYQPILFAGQYQDVETVAYEDDGATIHRPGLALNGARTYDPFVGGYLQFDSMANQTRSSYLYANSNPVGNIDPTGLASMDTGSGCAAACETDVAGDLNSADCRSYCEAIVDMGLGVPGDYRDHQDPYYTDDVPHSSVWDFGNQPCFDATCSSVNNSPVGPSNWYSQAQWGAPAYSIGEFGNQLLFAGWIASGPVILGLAGAGVGGVILGGAGVDYLENELFGGHGENIHRGLESTVCTFAGVNGFVCK